MGKRIRKKWDLPSEQVVALVVLGGTFLLGGGIGIFLAALSDGTGADALCAYLSDYMLLAERGELPRGLWAILWGQAKYLLAVFALGFTAVGVLALPVVMGAKGFFLGFSVACFCRVFGHPGGLPAFVLFGFPALLWGPALFLAGVQSFSSARALLRRSFGEGRRGGFYFGALDWCRTGLCVGLIVGCALAECWVVPVLLRAAARVVL